MRLDFPGASELLGVGVSWSAGAADGGINSLTQGCAIDGEGEGATLICHGDLKTKGEL